MKMLLIHLSFLKVEMLKYIVGRKTPFWSFFIFWNSATVTSKGFFPDCHTQFDSQTQLLLHFF